MKVKVIGKITKQPNGRWRAPICHISNGCFVMEELDSTYPELFMIATKIELLSKKWNGSWLWSGRECRYRK